MFASNFKITNKILSEVVKCELDFFYLKHVEVEQELIDETKRAADLKRLKFGLRIEGYDVEMSVLEKILVGDPERDESVHDFAIRINESIRERELQYVVNLLNAIRFTTQISYITNKFSSEKPKTNDLIRINSLLGERMVPSSKLGVFRNSEREELKYSPYPNEISYQLEAVIDWANRQRKEDINPLIVFSILLVEMLRIMPFESFNISTAIFFCLALLGSQGYVTENLVFEEEINRVSGKLSEMLGEAAKDNWDETHLIELVLELLGKSTSKAVARIDSSGSLRVKKQSVNGKLVALTDRQLLIVEKMSEKNEVAIKDIREILPKVSDDTILRDLKVLIAKKIVRKKGKTRAAVYVLKK